MHDKTSTESQSALDELGGQWSMVSCTRDGEPVPAGYVKWGKRVANGNEMTMSMAGKIITKAKFKIDPSRQPKEIDYAVLEGQGAGQTLYGIYELDGSILKFCVSGEGQARPRDFSSGRGSGQTLTIWRLDKR